MKKKKFSKKQINIIRGYWEVLQREEDKFYKTVQNITFFLAKHLGIENIEFIKNDGDWVGVGTVDRSYELLQFDYDGKVLKVK